MKVFRNNVDDSIMVVREITRPFDPAAVGMDATLVCEVESMSDLPSKHFQKCWRANSNGDAVEIDMDLARAQTMERIRAERLAKLEEADAVQSIKFSKGEDLTALFAMKEVLRNLPANVDLSAMTSEELETYDAIATVDLSAMA